MRVTTDGIEREEVITEWDKTFMDMALRVAKNSKCASADVACLLVRDGNILSMGINGTVSGFDNCNEKYKKEDDVWYINDGINGWMHLDDRIHITHHEWSNKYEVHAEINAITKATKDGISTRNATAYVTHSPCNNCTKVLVSAGITRIVVLNEYKENDFFNLIKKSNDITVVEMKSEYEDAIDNNCILNIFDNIDKIKEHQYVIDNSIKTSSVSNIDELIYVFKLYEQILERAGVPSTSCGHILETYKLTKDHLLLIIIINELKMLRKWLDKYID